MDERLGFCAYPRAFEYYPALKRVDKYVRTHLEGRISVRHAAAVAGLQPKYFSRFFHEKVGLTFTQWLAARRVERAAALLWEHNYPVVQVAQAAGLRTCRTCDRWFKRFKGVTPRQFKQHVKPS
jgi:transcriptional regulator GlxA family with amidase domain